MKREVKCRLVKIALENGEEEILGTSLLDTVKYKLPELGELYQIRWGAEEGYKMYKARVQVEAFSGKTATAVKQDIYAKVMMMTLCAALAFPIEEKSLQKALQINRKARSGTVKRSTAPLLIGRPNVSSSACSLKGPSD
ncbi:hypothetical protein ACQ86N_02880 [Puia sp. P3]|uniref:hypothetical protein n=1 Tax=Puia sp. P3 TaxID=3423952 RepID=UPI003D671EA3